MKKEINIFLIVLRSVLPFFCGTLFMFTGCITLYKPNAIHSPLLKEKGELNTSVSIGVSGSGLYNLQAAYAVSNHVGLMMDGMYHARSIKSADLSVERLNIFFGEVGTGYFTTFGIKKNGLFQCYSGGGYGVSRDKIEGSNQSSPEMNSKYFNLFIQPGVALVNEKIAVAFDMRVNYVNLYNVHSYLYDKFEWWNTNAQFFSDTSLSFVNIEPAVTIKGGGKKLKGFLQLGATLPVINSHSYFIASTSSMLVLPLIKFSMGMSYSFGKKKIDSRG